MPPSSWYVHVLSVPTAHLYEAPKQMTSRAQCRVRAPSGNTEVTDEATISYLLEATAVAGAEPGTRVGFNQDSSFFLRSSSKVQTTFHSSTPENRREVVCGETGKPGRSMTEASGHNLSDNAHWHMSASYALKF